MSSTNALKGMYYRVDRNNGYNGYNGYTDLKRFDWHWINKECEVKPEGITDIIILLDIINGEYIKLHTYNTYNTYKKFFNVYDRYNNLSERKLISFLKENNQYEVIPFDYTLFGKIY